jgi:hypothetical protein
MRLRRRLLLCQMTARYTSCRRAQHGVMTGIMACNSADDGTFNTSFGLGRDGSGDQRSDTKSRNYHSAHINPSFLEP